MQKRRLYLLLIGVGLVGALMAAVFRSREPEYGGKRLSEWVNLNFQGDSQGKKEAQTALAHIGSNAIPHLLTWIRYETPPWRKKLYGAINPMLERVNRWRGLTDGRQQTRADAAMDALIILGPTADGAIGELTQVANDPKRRLSRERAVCVCAGLGKAGLPALIGVLTNSPAEGKRWTPITMLSANMIMQMGTNAAPAIPALVNLLRDPDRMMRDAATNALREIDPQALERGTR